MTVHIPANLRRRMHRKFPTPYWKHVSTVCVVPFAKILARKRIESYVPLQIYYAVVPDFTGGTPTPAMHKITWVRNRRFICGSPYRRLKLNSGSGPATRYCYTGAFFSAEEFERHFRVVTADGGLPEAAIEGPHQTSE